MVTSAPIDPSDQISQALRLFRDYYNIAMHADYFLESSTGISGINVGKANMVNAASHFSSMLRTPNADEQTAELREIEKHLRDAIFESYDLAVSDHTGKFNTAIRAYKVFVAPMRWAPGFGTAPTVRRLKTILDLVKIEHVRGQNLGSVTSPPKKWEEGVKCYLRAVSLLKDAREIMGRFTLYSVIMYGAVISIIIGIVGR